MTSFKRKFVKEIGNHYEGINDIIIHPGNKDYHKHPR